mgnify:CR=1 FL=1
MDFEFLGLSDELLAAVREAGYTEPTPIQRQAIPAVLQGRDVIGIAQTGTGKTAGFTLPMLDILAQGRTKARMPRSLILEPTRELAAQVAESFETYGKHYRLSMALLIGGVSFSDQETKLERGVDVLIATPGRLLDHFERGKLMLTGVQVLVVDECDRMLDMGFIPDVERIVKLMPQRKQTLFFSATMPGEIKRLTDQFLRDPKVLEVAPPASPAETVRQFVAPVEAKDKLKALKSLLGEEEVTNALIFCNRKVDVKSVANGLKRAGMPADQLHGDMGQPERMEVLERFKSGELKLLVASDVAARGLDLPKVSHVVNFDVPQNAEDYIHRIGRTGRAGRKGVAVTFVTPREADNLADIEKAIGRSIEMRDLSGIAEAAIPRGEEGGAAGRGGKSPRGGGRRRGGRGRDKPKKDASGGQTRDESGPPADPPQEGEESERKDSGRKRSRRGGRRKRGETKSEPQPQPQTQPKSKSRKEESPKKPETASGKSDRNGGRRSRRKGQPETRERKGVVGLGEHVPAFLKRPVPKRGRASPADEADASAESESGD